jgi:hypothetical protein
MLFITCDAVNTPDFKLLAQLAECLAGTGLHADWYTLCRDKSCAEYQTELQHCIDQLVEIGRYEEGLHFVSLVGLSKDSVVIAQVSVSCIQSFIVQKGYVFIVSHLSCGSLLN